MAMNKTNIYQFLGKEFACPYCKQKHSIPVKKILTENKSICKISDFVSSLIDKKTKKKILILSDNITWEVAGKRCEEILKEKFKTYPLIIYPKNEKIVSAREEYMDRIFRTAEDKNLILTVGAGTITDLGKYTGDKLEIPVISFPTAPSNNAFTSGVSSLIVKGLKSVFPVRPVIGVLSDTEILAQAPLDLIKAGFADSLAKAFANSDWKISSLLTGENFCPLPSLIVTGAEKHYIGEGSKILKRDEKTIKLLMEGLNLGGISMLIAGKSSPASGGEHLISHFLDMYAHHKEKEIYAYHGIQVGVGIYISSLIYEKLKSIEPSDIDKLLKRNKIDYREKLEKIISVFPKGEKVIEKEFRNKQKVITLIRENLTGKWGLIKKEVFPLVYSPLQIKRILERANCPITLQNIGVEKEIILKDILLSRFIRRRLTVLDIADELGILEGIAEKYTGFP